MKRYRGNTTVSLDYSGLVLWVIIEYEVDRESNYGADADGKRGTPRTEVEILDKYIESPKINRFNSEQVNEILTMAEDRFYQHELWKGGYG